MSGPITVGYILLPGALELAKHALEEARAMKREYGEVADQLRAREQAMAAAKDAQQAARVERIAAVRREAERQSARVERLRALAGALPGLVESVPSAVVAVPADADDAAWSAHLATLQSTTHTLQAMLARAGGAYAESLRETLAAGAGSPTIDQVLGTYALQRRMNAALDPAEAERFRETAARVLGRIELEDGAAVPRELEALARAIVLAPSAERAEALASELRLGVQRHREAQREQRRESEDARRMLGELPAGAPDALLRALGYEVEDIEATLFCDGGVVHFRRAGWENYFVRMRVEPRERTANFNVVRAAGDEDTAERRRLDAIAEDRWCAEFPRLMETLASRGLAMDVTRRLEAGEVPVQVVEGASLPAVHGEDAQRPRSAPLARRTP